MIIPQLLVFSYIMKSLYHPIALSVDSLRYYEILIHNYK